MYTYINIYICFYTYQHIRIFHIQVGLSVGVVALMAAVSTLLHFHWRKASTRLLTCVKGTPANQRDLPYELRAKYTAVQLLGHGGSGIVVEVHQMHQEHQMKENSSFGRPAQWAPVTRSTPPHCLCYTSPAHSLPACFHEAGLSADGQI